MERQKIHREYLLNATSKSILWSAISTPTGLEGWFAGQEFVRCQIGGVNVVIRLRRYSDGGSNPDEIIIRGKVGEQEFTVARPVGFNDGLVRF